MSKQNDRMSNPDKQFQASDYKGSSELEQAFATTHEQVGDVYNEGTIEGVLQQENGKQVKVERKGYTMKKK